MPYNEAEEDDNTDELFERKGGVSHALSYVLLWLLLLLLEMDGSLDDECTARADDEEGDERAARRAVIRACLASSAACKEESSIIGSIDDGNMDHRLMMSAAVAVLQRLLAPLDAMRFKRR